MLRHRPGCDPRCRTPWSCPCGATDAYHDHQQALADDAQDRHEHAQENR